MPARLFRTLRILSSCLFLLLVVLISPNAVSADTILISADYDVDGRAGQDTVNLITGSGSFQIKITSSGGVVHNETYSFYGTAIAENVYIESLDGNNGREIIVLYTDTSGNRRLCIINRSKDYYTSTIQPERWTYSAPVLSQGLKTDYDSTKPISVNNLVVTELSGYAGKELIGVGGTGNRHLFIIRYMEPAGSNSVKVDEYTFAGSVENQILIHNLDGYQGDEVIGFFSSGSSKRLYIVNNQLEYDGYSRNYSKKLDFSFGTTIQSPNIQVAESVAHFTTQNVAIADLGTEPGVEIVGLYRDASSRLGLFRINYPKSNGYVGSDFYMPQSGVYTGLYDRLDDARYTIGELGFDGANGKEVYGYYNDSNSNLGGAFLYWDNFASYDYFQNLGNPDGNGNYNDGFHNLTSAGQTVGSAIFTQIDTDGDGHHNDNDLCPSYYGWVDADQDGTCAPRDECDGNADITSQGVCGCSTANQDEDPWLDCVDQCDNNPQKQYPGNCGCDYQDVDSDGDGVLDCDDGCLNDGSKQNPGVCGCDTPDIDSDMDGTPDCNDGCPFDETTTDASDCVADGCPQDPYKLDAGVCGCGVPDDNSDNDSAYDCNDGCPYDAGKTAPGVCGCNNPDDDLDGDGKADCLSQSATETTTYYHTDPAGTPLAITDSEGEVIWQATYLPFGEEYSVDGVLENDRRFIGKEKDEETGLTYFGARYLLEERFLSTDPVRVVNVGTEEINPTILADPQRLNLYAYGLNNPYRFIDPDGNIPIDTIWDAANVIYDVATGDKVSLAADLAAMAVPYLPAGVTKLGKVAKLAEKVEDTSKGGKTFDQARREAFEKAGMNDSNKVKITKYDEKTGTAVEFKGQGGAKVGYDGPHEKPGPHHDTQHISWQTAGKRGQDGAKRGNIPYTGQRHPSRSDRK